MNKRYFINLLFAVVLFSGVLYGAQNCGSGFDAVRLAQVAGQIEANGQTYRQVERLGRPAVNEGLLLSNDKLNAFNSIPPTADLATDNATVLGVLQEASASLDLVDSLEGNDNFGDGFESEVVAGFLPDVMRIDTTVSIPPGTAAYNGDFILVEGTQAAMLTGGRKLEDDVADITLSYLVAGDPTGQTVKDNVSYAGEPGNTAQGHSLLYGQSQGGGPARFPFLARPY